MRAKQVERQERVPEVIEHAHKQHHVEALSQLRDAIDGESAKFDIRAANFGGEAGLCEIALVGIDANHAAGAAALHLEAIKSGVTADIEHGLATKILWNRVREAPPFDRRIVAQEMMRRGMDAAQVD